MQFRILFFLILSILFVIQTARSQKTSVNSVNNRVELTADIISFNLEKNKGSDFDPHFLYVSLKAKLSNRSDRSIILLKKYLQCVDGDVSTGEGDLFSSQYFLSSTYYGSSNLPSYNKVKLKLEKLNPPPNETIIIAPKSHYEFEATLLFPLYRKETPGEPPFNKITTERLFQDLPLYLKFSCKTVPSILEKDGETLDINNFWITLQKKWQKTGLLLINEIKSEIVDLNLKVK